MDLLGSAKESPTLPESYRGNSEKERLLLSYAENFKRQFKKLYGDRKPLFLRPANECGVEKFVCTTLRPTCTPHKVLYDYDGCASFVADHVTLRLLDPPDELPKELVSPTLVLQRQEGTSFDLSCLLCSLLLGVGYDAYCVCGYAVREVTEMDQSHKTCPLLQENEEVEENAAEEKPTKYIVRPPKELSSQYLKRQAAKQKEKEERKRREEEEEARAAAAEDSIPDKYLGLRFHCWVLILSGKREVAQSFFIEPTTGESHSLDSDLYLGIETLWDHKNFWVNMQECSQGVKTLTYDLGDATRWEFFFPNVDKPLLVVPGDESMASMEEPPAKEEKDEFELPPSWVLPIHISEKELECRWPNGKKTTLYHKAQLERFAEYLNNDGLVSRLTLFQDTARRLKSEKKSYFKHRKDRLNCRVEHPHRGTVCEMFGPGRLRALKEHTSNSLQSASRAMLFYSYARVDGLSRRELTSTEMTEHFENRQDFLHCRQTTFTKLAKKEEGERREIKSIVEKFHRNSAVPANSDVAQRLFLLHENHIRIVYHLQPNCIISSTREFATPPRGGEQAYNLTFDPEATAGFEVDPYAPEPKSRHLFEQLERLMAAQEDSILKVRASEDETVAILSSRGEEEAAPQLMVSVYDVARNQKAFEQREEEEERMKMEEKMQREKEMDYLAPFLGRVRDPENLDTAQMKQVAEECLKDLRERLVDQANIIQARFEQETEELSRKQAWYKANQGSLTRDTETDYIAYCQSAVFRIHILEQRLNVHKSTAPEKYLQLERRLRGDPRLHEYYT